MSIDSEVSNLIEFWQKMDTQSRPFIHPDDDLRQYSTLTREEHNAHNASANPDFKYHFHTDLMPVPYYGDIQNARVYLLFLNPGFDDMDYEFEFEWPDYFQLFVNGLLQNNENRYPFPFLDPKYEETPAAQWWHGKLGPIIEHTAEQKGISYGESAYDISKKVATLELIPYHSKSCKASKAVLNLQSVQAIKQFVSRYVLARARKNKACVIIPRAVKHWNIAPEENVVVYERRYAQSASLAFQSPAWRYLIKFLE